MKKRLLLLLSLGALACTAAEKPNILFIMIDDLGWKDLHCQGNPAFTTPNIDRLAKQGMRFTDAYAAASICTPTRAAAMTGLYPARLKITQHGYDNWGFYKTKEWGPGKSTAILQPSYETIAETLKANGYDTTFIGKWHLSGREYSERTAKYLPENQGFDVNIGGNGKGGPGGHGSFFSPYTFPNLEPGPKGEYLPDRLAEEAVQRLKFHAQSDKPFFMCLWHYTVHWPIEATQELYQKYSDEKTPGNEQRYQAMVEGMDRAVGKTLDALDALGLTKDTLVIFTSDNGHLAGYTSAAPLRASKGYLYEGGIRVPMIVRWPGKVKSGTTNPTPAITIDFAPTFLEAAHIPYADTKYDGISLVGDFTGEKPSNREAIYFHYPHYAFHSDNRMGSVIRAGNLKLIERCNQNEYELFDLSKDISEENNLINELPEKAAELKKRLAAWQKETQAEAPRLRSSVPEKELAGRKQ